MKKQVGSLLLSLLLAGCQLFASHPTVVDPSVTEATLPSSALPKTSDEPAAFDQQTGSENLQASPSGLFSDAVLRHWQPQPYIVQLDNLPIDMRQVSNPEALEGLTNSQRKFLVGNGFVVQDAAENQFEDIRLRVADQHGQPYYLTTDAAYYALNQTYAELLKALEQDYLRPQMTGLLQATLDRVLGYQKQAVGTTLESDVRLASEYLAVALRLFDPQASLPPELAKEIKPQVDQVLAAGAKQPSKLMPDFIDDYQAYQPTGHYTTSRELKNYFRGMTWLKQMTFKLKDLQNSAYQPSRAPLILTLALEQAQVGEQNSAAETWKTVQEMLNFLSGPTSGLDPSELASLMESVYGKQIDINELMDEGLWVSFLTQVGDLSAPLLDSSFAQSTVNIHSSWEWHWIGQHYALDDLIFENLVYDKVSTQQQPRKIPSVLDMMAVFGSPAAQSALVSQGESTYANYTNQLFRLQKIAQDQTEPEWLNSFSSTWLYTFFPMLAAKGEAYPPAMRTNAWNYRELNSALGSWVLLKHDGDLTTPPSGSSKNINALRSGPAPAYVEANPDVFYRLSYLANTLYEGLNARGIGQRDNGAGGSSLSLMMTALQEVAAHYQRLGEIAASELVGKELSVEDFATIQECIGPFDCHPGTTKEPVEAPAITTAAEADGKVLAAGTGNLDRIYVVVSINGELQVAEGGVFSYYEFIQSRSLKVDDNHWRAMLKATFPPAHPNWTPAFLLPGGVASNALAFRLNDVYITTQGMNTPPLNLRAEASVNAAIIQQLPRGTYVRLIEGPVQADGLRWWKIQVQGEVLNGWAAENSDWYARAYGQ